MFETHRWGQFGRGDLAFWPAVRWAEMVQSIPLADARPTTRTFPAPPTSQVFPAPRLTLPRVLGSWPLSSVRSIRLLGSVHEHRT